MLVRGITTTPKIAIPDGYKSWLNYWKSTTKASINYCGSVHCHEVADTITLVRKEEAFEDWNPIYAIPLCFDCHAKIKTIPIQCDRSMAVIVPTSNRI